MTANSFPLESSRHWDRHRDREREWEREG